MLHPGIYRHPSGEIIRLRLNRRRTRVYAERWTNTMAWDANADLASGTWYFADAYGYERELTSEMRLPLEEARKISIEAGQCLACAKILTDPKSQAEGIGPVCIKSFAYDEQIALLGIEGVA